MNHAFPLSKKDVREEVLVPAGNALLHGELSVPCDAQGVVLFAHGSGSSRRSPRNQNVASVIREAGMATLLFDLLTEDEEELDDVTRELRFNIGLIAERLVSAARWVKPLSETRGLKIGFFGASTGGAAALVAAAELGTEVGAVVSRGGRPDLAGDSLRRVKCPTLLIVGGDDEVVITLNQAAYDQLPCQKELKLIPGATHLFGEPGKLEEVARLSAAWFQKYLGKAPP